MLAAACAAIGLFVTGCEQAAPPSGGALPAVTVAPPLVRTTRDWDEFVGQFQAVERVEVRPRVSGYLRDIHFTDGALVEPGDLLFTIDARPFQAALDAAQGRAAAAEAELENARTQLARGRELVAVDAMSKEEFESLEARARTAEAALAAARAAVRAATLDVEFTRVTAPIRGRISYRRVDRGNAVVADDTVLTTIVSVDPIYFVFQGSESLYLKYKRAGGDANGRPVQIRLQDEREPRWHGTLDFLDNAIDASTGTIRGRAVVPNPDGFLTPGMFGYMLLQASEEYSGLLLPDSAIATRGADRIVYVVDDDGTVAAKEIELGPLSAGLRVIRSGITATDRVIIDGQQRARPGQRVDARVTAIEPVLETGLSSALGGR
jgi:multidrug efflux system membrane fusion protein